MSDDVFTATLQAAQADVAYAERVTPVLELDYGDRARIPGQASRHAVIAAEDLGDGFVRVLWRCDRGDNPVEPSTIFRADEHLLLA